MTQQNQIPSLGEYVEDVVSGLTGTMDQLIYKLGGSIQGSVQPYSNDGKTMLDSWYVDLQRLRKTYLPSDRVDVSGSVIPVDNTLESSNYPLGMTVIDSFTGIRVKILHKSVHMNGCVNYMCVRSRIEDGETVIAETWLNQHRLVPETVEPIAPPITQPDPIPQQAENLHPGGPSMKAPRL